ncbi:hypothetical protein ACP86_00025 [Marinobacter sp. CP1]|uniref:glycosyltransferase family 4 protein n=1 Tax=Marinobacter sp. CP1 TaxID=1671721 RepID=UPI00069E130A|nr:glycosyltransferase family 4 protein [Marinobacter sp. CP1]AKV94690.1 hypothetical protein ACP86_00025 [Marinobacter sp. CP1]
MKVLWLSHLIPYPPKGGVLQRTFNMIKEVSQYHDVTLVAFNQTQLLKASLPDQDDPLKFAVSQMGKFVESIHIIGSHKSKRLGGSYGLALKALLGGKAYNMEWMRSREARREIEDILEKEYFDVVHLDTISLCVYADLFERFPIVLNHHNFESAMLRTRASTESNFLKSLYFRLEASRLYRSEKYYCSRSDLNLTCSDEDADSMQNLIPNARFTTVPNGVDISYFYPNQSVQVVKKSIVIVGGLSWYPNREAVEFFIRRIWPTLKERIPELVVDVIGRGPTTEMLRLAESDQRFRVHGFVDDVRDYLWQAQVYLCPIRTGGGTKLKILDALASGCCIIADPFSCKGINVTNGVNVMYARTPKDYVDEIIKLLEDPALEKGLKKEGPKLIRNQYSYSEIGKQYAKILETLLEQDSQTRKAP